MEHGEFSAKPFLPIFRIVVLCLSFVLAVIVMSLSAHWTSFMMSSEGEAKVSALLAIVTAGLTILTLPIMLIVDFLCKRAFTSMVLVEFVWLSILWMLWLSTGVDGADSTNTSFPDGCNGYVNGALSIACRDSVGIIALSFLNFVLLLAYSIALLVFATISSNRGHSIWTSSVKEADLLAPSNTLAHGGRALHSLIPSCS